jgi:hypothetical protein
VSGNTSGGENGTNGGGIIAINLTVTHSTISGNLAANNGGGVAIAGGATILGCTIADNSAGINGGGLFVDATNSSPILVKNTIVATNLGSAPDISGSFTSQGHNLIGDGDGGTGFINGGAGDQVGTTAQPIDPRLGLLAANGGPTKTHALLAGSRAIDAGDNLNLPPTDQRGLARKKDGNFNGVAVVDIGAFER